MNRILHDANNAQRILKLTADTMLLVDRHGVCVDIEPHCDLWFLQEDILLGKNYGSRSKKGEIPRFELSHNALNRKPQK